MSGNHAIAATSVVALIIVAQSAAANATPEDPSVSTETHCVINVIGERPTGELLVGEPRCYLKFSEAVEDVTKGSIQLPENTRGTILFKDARFASSFSSFTLGTHYDGYNGSGSSISVVGSSCTGGYWNTGISWRNRISSSYNGCTRLRHYDYANLGGASENTYGAGTIDNLGSLNNRTESVSYHSS